MPIDDPATWAQGLTAAKTAFDSIRSAIGMVKDVQSLGGGTEEQRKAIDTALTTAQSSTAIAEAQLAQAFGYELCKCEFPPTPMKTMATPAIAKLCINVPSAALTPQWGVRSRKAEDPEPLSYRLGSLLFPPFSDELTRLRTMLVVSRPSASPASPSSASSTIRRSRV